MKVKSEGEVAQSCTTLSDPTDCSLPGSSVHGIFQARLLEWDAIMTALFTRVLSSKRYPPLNKFPGVPEGKINRVNTGEVNKKRI